MDIMTETITPELAAAYLQFNRDNRPVRPTRVKELADCIDRGEWVLTHQGIAFNTRGELIDGQHRLLACIRAGKPITVLVSRGCQADTFKVLDTHARRSYADIFRTSSHEMAAISLIANMVYGTHMKPGPEQIMTIMGTQVGRTCRQLLEHGANGKSPVGRASWVAGCAVMCALGHHEYAKRLFEDIRLCRTECLPPVGSAFLRASLNGTLLLGNSFTARRTGFLRALGVFDPAKRNNTMIRPVEAETGKKMLMRALHELRLVDNN